MQTLYLEGTSAKELGEKTLGAGFAVKRFPWTIGRHSECDQCLPFPFISRRHCTFFVRDDQIWVEDLASQNGTFLNGRSLRDAQPIHDGDRLDLAYLSFQVHLDADVQTDEESTIIQVAEMPRRAQHLSLPARKVEAEETVAMVLKTPAPI
jgi:pSer/pThr/pTyr-binding forkhead associated (FHA) protein